MAGGAEKRAVEVMKGDIKWEGDEKWRGKENKVERRGKSDERDVCMGYG